jgi:hypothetical protein
LLCCFFSFVIIFFFLFFSLVLAFEGSVVDVYDIEESKIENDKRKRIKDLIKKGGDREQKNHEMDVQVGYTRSKNNGHVCSVQGLLTQWHSVDMEIDDSEKDGPSEALRRLLCGTPFSSQAEES